MNRILLFPLLFLSVFASAQTTPELITDRPDQTESSAVVPHKFLQIETGFLLENKSNNLLKHKSYAFNSTLLRYGLLHNFELRLGLEYLSDRFEMKQQDTTSKIAGFGPLYTGFKVKIADEDGWKPEIAFLGGFVFPFTAKKDYKPSHVAADMRLAFSHTLSDRFSLGYNLGAEWDGESAGPLYFYSIALGVGLTNNLSIFAESFGLLNPEGEPENLVDAGFTYLILQNLQVDLSGGIGLNDQAIDNFISFGLTLRIPN
jgi:hypothetical protein